MVFSMEPVGTVALIMMKVLINNAIRIAAKKVNAQLNNSFIFPLLSCRSSVSSIAVVLLFIVVCPHIFIQFLPSLSQFTILDNVITKRLAHEISLVNPT